MSAFWQLMLATAPRSAWRLLRRVVGVFRVGRSLWYNLPMRRPSSILFVLWLLLVLPAQAALANTGAPCHSATTGAHLPTQHTALHSAVDGGHLGHDGAGASPSTPACKGCSPCCLMALSSVPASATLASVPGDARFPDPPPLHRSTVPNGLERPPRTSLG